MLILYTINTKIMKNILILINIISFIKPLFLLKNVVRLVCDFCLPIVTLFFIAVPAVSKGFLKSNTNVDIYYLEPRLFWALGFLNCSVSFAMSLSYTCT